MTRPRALLSSILLLYVALATLFAVYTPSWQAPDEPAHYNYVGYVAAHGGFPVLQMGDYPHTYLEEIKGRGFPPDLSIAPIRYEFHQPPLYYVLAAPIFNLTGGDPLALRLLSVFLGAGIVLLTYAIARRVFPDRPGLALGAAAFVAFLPQHLATVSQIGNDVLAELLFALVLFVLIGELRGTAGNSGELRGTQGNSGELGGTKERTTHHASRITHHALRLGLLLGLILVTKTTAYIAVPLAGGVIVWRWWQERASLRRMALEALAVIVPAAVIALPWYARDIAVYGWPDFLGLIRHDAIVIGQTRTVEFIAQAGWGAYWQRAVEFTFKSFWGVFGWLGVFMDSRVYFALAVLSGVTAAGLGLRIANGKSQIANRRWQMADGKPSNAIRNLQFAVCNSQFALLAISALLTLLVYAWYNTQFVQHQGRYLFTALIPIALAFVAGWEGAVRPRVGRWLAVGLVIFGIGLVAWGVTSGAGLPKWPLAITALFAVGLVVADLGQQLRSRSTQQCEASLWDTVRITFFVLPFAALPLLSLYALFGAIVPQLTR